MEQRKTNRRNTIFCHYRYRSTQSQSVTCRPSTWRTEGKKSRISPFVALWLLCCASRVPRSGPKSDPSQFSATPQSEMMFVQPSLPFASTAHVGGRAKLALESSALDGLWPSANKVRSGSGPRIDRNQLLRHHKLVGHPGASQRLHGAEEGDGGTGTKLAVSCDPSSSDCLGTPPPAAIQLKDQSQLSTKAKEQGFGSILAGSLLSGLAGAVSQNQTGPYLPGTPAAPGMTPGVPGMPPAPSGAPGVLPFGSEREAGAASHPASGLSTGAIIGITFGVLVALLAIFVIAGFVYKRMKKKRRR